MTGPGAPNFGGIAVGTPLAVVVGMTTSASGVSFERSSAVSASAGKSPIVRARIGIAVVLTAIVALVGLALAVTLGKVAFLVYALTMPVPLALLWLSSDVLRADERGARPVE
ncbi:MAG: hypothetical protein K0S65_2287 [Labilithrix sp.]|nr:hypothetical protein [Labilithrix sp.]